MISFSMSMLRKDTGNNRWGIKDLVILNKRWQWHWWFQEGSDANVHRKQIRLRFFRVLIDFDGLGKWCRTSHDFSWGFGHPAFCPRNNTEVLPCPWSQEGGQVGSITTSKSFGPRTKGFDQFGRHMTNGSQMFPICDFIVRNFLGWTATHDPLGAPRLLPSCWHQTGAFVWWGSQWPAAGELPRDSYIFFLVVND